MNQQKGLAAVSLLLATVAVGFAISQFQRVHESSTANYDFRWEKPEGFVARPHGPHSIYLYEHEKNGVMFIGAVNRVYSEVNPTPDLHTDGIAQFYVDRTHENQKGWSAKTLEKVHGKDIDFRIVRREGPDKVVVTAFGVKGNTTVMLSMTANVGKTQYIDGLMPTFRNFLTKVEAKERPGEYEPAMFGG
ncbi:MAG: hypothetical protein ACOYON_14530 [Fimbriimonas sp.]